MISSVSIPVCAITPGTSALTATLRLITALPLATVKEQ